MRARWILATLAIFSSCLAAGYCHAEDPVGSQLDSEQNAVEKNEEAARRARKAGRNSIARGVKNMRVGKATFNPPQVKLGAVQIARGLLGLLAAQKAQEMAEIAKRRAAFLNQLKQRDSDGSAIVKGHSEGNGITGGSSEEAEGSPRLASSGASTKFNPDDIALPEVKEALLEMKEAFGLTKRDVLKTLHDKKDDKFLLTEGPKMAMTKDEYKAALKKDESSISDDTDFATGLVAYSHDSSQISASTVVEKELRRPQPPAQSKQELSLNLAAGGSRERLLHPGRSAAGDDEEYLDGEELDQARRQLASLTDELNLFDVVHRKYQEKERELLHGIELRTATIQP